MAVGLLVLVGRKKAGGQSKLRKRWPVLPRMAPTPASEWGRYGLRFWPGKPCASGRIRDPPMSGDAKAEAVAYQRYRSDLRSDTKLFVRTGEESVGLHLEGGST